jgi:2-polyprenyl-6-methoxyphenol hydroxylase-like FAD-dependent oxidoreductase
MSPVGGIGINIALQDAVATANILTESLLSDSVTVHNLTTVQNYREPAVRRTQRIQAIAHTVINRVFSKPTPVQPPLTVRLISSLPMARRTIGRFIGMGLQPQHIETPSAFADRPPQ